jgi:transcription factor STE12
MERPFQCHRCNKKFSRQDNLTQHFRIHMRMDAEGAIGTTASYMASMGEDESGHADIEDLEELEGIDGGLLNIGVCEVEVEGIVHDVEGDEEGLITTNPTGYVAEPNGIHPIVGQDAYYSGSAPDHQFPMSSSPEPSPFSDPSGGANWMARATPSPAFSTQSMPSPHQRVLHMSQPGSYNQMGDYVTSMSAPSHKATFDHTAIYPGQLLASSGPGPIRRHRSVTPSLARYGESIRRPYSAAMTDQSAPGNRSYHPYAVSSHSGSAQSSPGTYSVPLDYNTSITGSLPSHLSRSSSTSRQNSSSLPDQMNQMLHLDSMDTGYAGESTTTTAATTTTGGSFGGLYRSDSPASYTSATYSHSGGSTDGHQMYPMHPQYASHVDQYYPPHAQTVPL